MMQDKPMMIARDWRKVDKKTLQGVVTLETASGLVLKEVCVHQRGSSRWIAMPSRPWTKADGTTAWISLIEFKTKEKRDAFQEEALAAVDVMQARLAGVSQ